jgi:hypothetical protein
VEFGISVGKDSIGNVSFSNESLIAQRLVTAFAFAGAASNWQSVLRVEDPPPDNDHVFYKIEAETAAPIVESINRVSTIRGLVLAGVYDVAAHAFPTETESDRVAGRLLERSTPFEAEGREWIADSALLVGGQDDEWNRSGAHSPELRNAELPVAEHLE